MVFCDLIQMNKSEEIEKFAKSLGFGNVLFREDIVKLNIIHGKDDLYNRLMIEKGIDILLNPHTYELKDNLHFRRGGLNQVSCKLAAKKDVVILFTLDSLRDHLFIGRAMQDIKMCRKYCVKVMLCTYAKSKYELKSLNDLFSFCKILGMDGKQVKNAFVYPEKIIKKCL
jgi:RNase P/RNase MRP subunit p30